MNRVPRRVLSPSLSTFQVGLLRKRPAASEPDSMVRRPSERLPCRGFVNAAMGHASRATSDRWHHKTDSTMTSCKIWGHPMRHHMKPRAGWKLGAMRRWMICKGRALAVYKRLNPFPLRFTVKKMRGNAGLTLTMPTTRVVGPSRQAPPCLQPSCAACNGGSRRQGE